MSHLIIYRICLYAKLTIEKESCTQSLCKQEDPQTHLDLKVEIYNLPTPKSAMCPILRDGHISYIEGWVRVSCYAIMHYSLYVEKAQQKLSSYARIYLGIEK